ncbi:MAG: (R)-hydratase [Rhodobacteraceae bacterium]|nr:(R)-hydratase [Paracoccaceae bacterium]
MRGHSHPVGTLYIDELEVGMSRFLEKKIDDDIINAFAMLSSDYNPIHMDEAYAAETPFKGRIAHGMIGAGLISAVIGEQLPGHGTIYLKQDLKFSAPVRPDDIVRAVVTIHDIDIRTRRVGLDCVCTVGDTVVITGKALVLAPRRG